jgi:hypothetical protein
VVVDRSLVTGTSEVVVSGAAVVGWFDASPPSSSDPQAEASSPISAAKRSACIAARAPARDPVLDLRRMP